MCWSGSTAPAAGGMPGRGVWPLGVGARICCGRGSTVTSGTRGTVYAAMGAEAPLPVEPVDKDMGR